jgi:hypothetical protein
MHGLSQPEKLVIHSSDALKAYAGEILMVQAPMNASDKLSRTARFEFTMYPSRDLASMTSSVGVM